MSDNLARLNQHIATLETRLASEEDPAIRDVLSEKLAALKAQRESLLNPRHVAIRDQAQVGTVIQGDTHGSLTIGPITFNAPPPASSGGPEAFAGYRAGLDNLLTRLGRDHPRYHDALVYEQRLRENLAATEREGDTETRRAERAAVLAQLNALAVAAVGVSFNELCGEA